MDLINKVEIDQEKFDELKELGSRLSPEQIECLKLYEIF